MGRRVEGVSRLLWSAGLRLSEAGRAERHTREQWPGTALDLRQHDADQHGAAWDGRFQVPEAWRGRL